MVTILKYTVIVFYEVTQLGRLSLAILSWVGVMNTGHGYGHREERNGEFCVTVGPVTRTAGILTQSVKGAGCQ